MKTMNVMNMTRIRSHLSVALKHSALATMFAVGALHADPVIYEPFAQPVGPLNGQTAGTGLSGNWSGNNQVNVAAGSLAWGTLSTSGNHVVPSGTAQTAWYNVGIGVSSGTTLSDAGLLAPGAELWFSCVAESISGNDMYFCLGNGVADGWGRMGSGGVGFILRNGNVIAYPGNNTGGWQGPAAAIPNGVNLIVGKITWGPDSLTSGSLSIYLPGTDLVLPAAPVSTESTHVIFDQSTFTTLSFAPGWGNSGTPFIDEIRFGATYADVTPAGAADTTPPSPDPMTWDTVPAGADENAITMTATTATDPSGVEYLFHCTTAGGHDSAWQSSPVYTDTGLTPATSYSYMVQARDMVLNTTAWSSVKSASTLPADTTPPDPSPMTWAAPPVAGSNTAIGMTATTATDPHGVEYFFTNTTVSGHDSGWQASASYVDVGLSPGTTYTYQVKASDKSLARNETLYAEASATTALLAPMVIYEPFAGATGALNGQSAGTGLSGTWWGNDQVNVVNGSLAWGSLLTSGHHVEPTGTAPEWYNNGAGVSPGNSLSYAGLLAPGAELWFSCLVQSTGDSSSTYFCLGDTVADGWGRMGDAGGVGFVLDGGMVYAYPGNGAGGSRGPGAAISNGVNLIVGKITWGPDNSTSGSISIYLPGTDLALPATPASTQSTAVKFDQSTFNTISFAPGNGQTVPPVIDEIRFGGSYETVVPAAGYSGWAAGPFPSGKALTDTNPAHDFDGGGLPTGIEWVVKGDPTNGGDDASVTPTLDNTTDVSNFLFIFRRAKAAGEDANTSIAVEYGSDLSGWRNTIDNGLADGVTTSVDAGGFGTGIDKVTVAIPRTLGNKLFARLKVVVTTP